MDATAAETESEDETVNKAAGQLRPIRQPALFYACVLIAFGFLGAASLAFLL